MQELRPTDPVSITLSDGKARELRYSLGAMRRLKKKFGQSLLSKDALLALDEDTIPDLIYEGLSTADKQELSADAIAELIDSRELKTVLEKFFEAFSGSKPEKNGQTPTVLPMAG